MSISTDHLSLLILIAGISGAGKSSALDFFSDAGFFVVDNLPVPLFPDFLKFTKGSASRFNRTALLLDVGSDDKLHELNSLLDQFDPQASNVVVLFFDARNETVLKRYSETRRPHPAFNPEVDNTLLDTISRERNRLVPLKERANFVLDTSDLTIHDYRRKLQEFLESLSTDAQRRVRVNFVSFGFKYGVPIDCDLVVDVRFLPNPHFIDEFKLRTGKEKPVADYVLNAQDAQDFLEKYTALLEFLLPRYAFEGKSYLNIGVGCTGGKHRSVAIAEALMTRVSGEKFLLSVSHRDIEK